MSRLVTLYPAAKEIILQANKSPAGLLPFAEFNRLSHYGEKGFYNSGYVQIGMDGDFTTDAARLGKSFAIAVSKAWKASGRPEKFTLVEAGAGHGQMMLGCLDYLAAHHPELYQLISPTIVEISPALIARQRDTLGAHREKMAWLNKSVLALPKLGKVGMVISNEILDDLPFAFQRLWVKTENGQKIATWHNLHVKYDDQKDKFSFVEVNSVKYLNIPNTSRWELVGNRSEIPGLDFKADEEEIKHQLSLLSRSNPTPKSYEPYIVGTSAASCTAYVEKTLNAFDKTVSIFIDYGVRDRLPGVMLFDHGQKSHDIAIALRKPGQVNPTHVVDFGWAEEAAEKAGAQVANMKRADFLAWNKTPSIPLLPGEEDHLVQIQTRGLASLRI